MVPIISLINDGEDMVPIISLINGGEDMVPIISLINIVSEAEMRRSLFGETTIENNKLSKRK